MNGIIKFIVKKKDCIFFTGNVLCLTGLPPLSYGGIAAE